MASSPFCQNLCVATHGNETRDVKAMKSPRKSFVWINIEPFASNNKTPSIDFYRFLQWVRAHFRQSPNDFPFYPYPLWNNKPTSSLPSCISQFPFVHSHALLAFQPQLKLSICAGFYFRCAFTELNNSDIFAFVLQTRTKFDLITTKWHYGRSEL